MYICDSVTEKASEEEQNVNLVNKENNTQTKLNEQIKLVNGQSWSIL